MGYILGIDQGSTKTYAAVAGYEGTILSCYRTEGSYFPATGIEPAMFFINVAVENALLDAGIKMNDLDIIVAGINGIDWDGDDTLVTEALQRLFGDKDIFACNDCEIAYYSGAFKPVGACICAGTGINAAFFAPNGEKFLIGDYFKDSLQGASGISKRAIEAVFESDLGVLPETRLTKLFLDFINEDSVFKLLQRFVTEKSFSQDILSLVPQIIAIADHGDQVTLDLLSAFSDELCACFIAAMKKMDMLDLKCDIVLTGSVFKGERNSLPFMITEKLLQSAKNINIINARFEPIVGACILGMLRKTGCFDEHMIRNVSSSCEKLGLLR